MSQLLKDKHISIALVYSADLDPEENTV